VKTFAGASRDPQVVATQHPRALLATALALVGIDGARFYLVTEGTPEIPRNS